MCNAEGFEKGSDAGVVEDVELGIVVLGNVELPEFDWSAIIEDGVWMAFVSDESTDDACE